MFLEQNGLNVWKDESTRDLICLDFDFGSRSYEEEIFHINELISKSNNENKESLLQIRQFVEDNKYKYQKKSKDEIRDLFYQNGVPVTYHRKDKKGNMIDSTTINYNMLYRNSSKAKLGQVMFINKELYDIAYDWLTMGLGKKLPKKNAKIVEMSAYAPLTTSTIIDTLHIPVEDILILEDQDSFFTTVANVVRAEDYECEEKVVDVEKTTRARQKALLNEEIDLWGNPIYKQVYKKQLTTKKKCVCTKETVNVKNTLWDGMGIIEDTCLPHWINGMALLRHHFFKMDGFRGKIQQFFQDWCKKTGNNYETYEVVDMFGIPHKLKDIKVITTNNAIKWIKFKDLMGDTLQEAYAYWCEKVNNNGSLFGIVKTDHQSKLGSIQQMSYQMINTLPCSENDVKDIAQTSIDYVELLKKDDLEFENFLRKNANEVNHYEMMADLYKHNPGFANSKWFRNEKKKVINTYVSKLRSGKITVNGDNLTVCGNPYALLMYSVGEDWNNDPTFTIEEGVVQCYTTRFNHNEYLAAFRNPHNSPNNIVPLHNVYSEEMIKYFPFSPNIMAVNCIHTDIQDRTNGCDFDSDFFFTTNHPTIVKNAQKAYKEFPTIVNQLKEGGISYDNTLSEYARMDNIFAKSKRRIGESSNLAQLALTYYWSSPSQELYDNFAILSVLAQIIIDGCKRVYEVDAISEIERIKKMHCMVRKNKFGKVTDFPLFMKYTKEVPVTKNNKPISIEKITNKRNSIKKRIDTTLICPMNWLQNWLDKIQGSNRSNTIPTEDFFIKIKGRANPYQITKISKLVSDYDLFIKSHCDQLFNEDFILEFEKVTSQFYDSISKIKIGNIATINKLIRIALSIDVEDETTGKRHPSVKYSRRLLNTLYKSNKEKFLLNFVDSL